MTKAAHFEAKKHAYRQCQDGIVISFVVHPNDVSAEMATAPLGSRYMVAFAAIGDDEQPKQPEKPRQKWGDLAPSQQAGILCADPRFRDWLSEGRAEMSEDDAAERVRQICQCVSRRTIGATGPSLDRWNDLVSRYRQATGQMAEQRGS